MEAGTEELKTRVYQGATKKNLALDAVVLERIENELSIILETGFSDYFVLMARIVEVCNELQLLRSFGRGTSPNSLINYCLDITMINPIEYNLPFERFMLPYRELQPVNDIDIPKGSQYKVLNRLKEKYREYNTYSIAVESKNEDDLSELSKDGIPLKVLSFGFIITKDVLPSFRIAGSDRLYYLSVNPKTDIYVMNKINLVEQSYLNKLQSICESIGVWNHPYQIPLDDSMVLELFRKGNTQNIFCFDYENINDFLIKFKPESLLDLAIVHALFRPSLWNLKSELIHSKNKHDRTFGFDNSKINEILSESYGLLIFQETFMHIASEFGDITFTEAEIWRKGIYIDKSGFKMEEFLLEFSNSCRQKNTINDHDISVLTKLISNNLPNTFSKAHAISYASIAYWGAYYKTYYPGEFIEVFYSEEDIPF